MYEDTSSPFFYYPLNLPVEFQIDGLHVIFSADIEECEDDAQCIALPITLTKIKEELIVFIKNTSYRYGFFRWRGMPCRYMHARPGSNRQIVGRGCVSLFISKVNLLYDHSYFEQAVNIVKNEVVKFYSSCSSIPFGQFPA